MSYSAERSLNFNHSITFNHEHYQQIKQTEQTSSFFMAVCLMDGRCHSSKFLVGTLFLIGFPRLVPLDLQIRWIYLCYHDTFIRVMLICMKCDENERFIVLISSQFLAHVHVDMKSL